MSKRFSMAAAWAEFEHKVLSGASPVQRDEMRKAFYCGGVSIFFGLIMGLDPSSPDATDGDLAQMDAIKTEFEAFQAEMAGRAAARSGGMH
jgi:hypothetical protein